MSKLRGSFLLTALLLVTVTFVARAQMTEVRVKVDAAGLINVEGSWAGPKTKNFYFLKERGGIEIPGTRVSDVILSDESGHNIPFRQLAPGEYLAEAEFVRWSYKIKPSLSKSGDAAHVSWLGADGGILMGDDLLPKFGTVQGPVFARISFDIPPGWDIAGVDPRQADGFIRVSDTEKAVLRIGKAFRSIALAEMGNLTISGEWRFKDEEAAKMVSEIFAEYEKVFGSRPGNRSEIVLSKFPTHAKFGVWEAETRGRTVTILSGDMPFEAQSLQLLHEQLRHEIFHFWIPNGVNLSGNYDWFYEGFALYQALRSGVAVNRIRFTDMLDTLARAYNVDSAQSQRTSLVDASKSRWAGGNTQIYARGMLVAFLCDITLLRDSKGNSDIFKEIYSAHASQTVRQDGNTVVLATLEKYGLKIIADRYIRGSENIAWKNELDSVGVAAEETNLVTRLKVKEKPSGRQKAFLDKLGYNNWRKMSRN